MPLCKLKNSLTLGRLIKWAVHNNGHLRQEQGGVKVWLTGRMTRCKDYENTTPWNRKQRAIIVGVSGLELVDFTVKQLSPCKNAIRILWTTHRDIV